MEPVIGQRQTCSYNNINNQRTYETMQKLQSS